MNRISAKIVTAIVDQIHTGLDVQTATKRAAFNANAEAEAKGWSLRARALLLEDFAQAGVTILTQSRA
ncbi:MAG: hypothetical protein LC792_00410 [Actinobacteria bacterium]|nr:hypothetical protein [Actinomycetota bacterium]